MFEAVTITSDNIDSGLVAEALVYYGRVNVVVSGGGLLELIKTFGRDNLVRAIDHKALQLTYERDQYAVHSEAAPFLTHSFQRFHLSQSSQGIPINNVADEISEMFERTFGKSWETRAFAKKMADLVVERDLRDEIINTSHNDALNRDFMTEAIRSWIKEMVPEIQLPEDFRIDSMDTGKGIALVTGLDFEEINKFYHRRIPATHSSVSPAFLLAHIISLRKEMVFGAGADSDVWLGPGNAAILRTKTDALVKMSGKSRTSIKTFHDVEFEGRSFREAINSGERTPDELLTLLEHPDTQKFKAWIAQQRPDANFVKEFERAVVAKIGWTQKLPFRFGKIATFAGIGALIDVGIGTMGLASLAASGLSALTDAAVGTSDEFLLSKLLKGWKPNQFIDGPAKQFVSSDS